MKNGENQQLLLDLFRAYFDTRKNKRATANALVFEADYENKLFKLYRDIMNREYKIGRSVCFIVDKPVKREIFAADFRDRIVHHLIFNYINPIFEKHFIKDSYSCRIGKGTSQGIKQVDHFIRSCSENYQKECWILKLDVKGYFMAMDRNILYTKIEQTLLEVKNPNFDMDLVLYLIRAVIFNNPTEHFLAKGQREDWIGLPKSKSLFFAKKGKGFPVGNLTSQLFSNIYLDTFDHFVREELGIKMYGRYVDDMVFIHHDKEFLKSIIGRVKEYLQKELQLTLHPKKIYLQNFKKGVGFLGTFIKPWRIYIGEKTKQNLYAKVKMWNEFAKENNGLGGKEVVGKFVATVNSYLGIMSHYDTRRLREKISRSFGSEIFKSIVFSKDLEKVEVLVEKKKKEPVRALVPSIFAQKSRAYIFIAMLFTVFAIQAVFPSVASAAYFSSGTVTSTNLISGSSASAITNFHYTISSLPSTSSVTVQFSTDNTNWYSASGVLNGSNTLSTTGGADLSLTGGWTGTAFYYKLTINATTDLTDTPVIDDIQLDYTATGGYGNTFVFSSAGNVGIGQVNPTLGPLQMGSGAYVTTGGVWTNASDRNLKENFTTMDPETILAKIATLPITQWNYKSESASTTHIGPVAQDFFAAFGLGGSDTSISTIDPAGVALLGIQALNSRINSILNGTATSTITNIAYQNASTTVTDTLCLGGDCRTAWAATASSTSPDFAGYVSTTTLASSLAGYALLSSIPDVSSFVSTSTLASSLAPYSLRSDLGNYALRSDLDASLASATSTLATLDTRLAAAENSIAALASGYAMYEGSISSGSGFVNPVPIIAKWSFSSSTPGSLVDNLTKPPEGIEPSEIELTNSLLHLAGGVLSVYSNLAVDSLIATSSVWTSNLAVTNSGFIQHLAVGPAGITFADNSSLTSANGMVSTSTLASTLAGFASRSDLGNYASRSNLDSALASATSSLYAALANIPSASLSGTVTGSMIPNTDNTYTLGSPTNRFTDIYAKNVNAGDLTFTETTSAVSGNTLMPGDTIGLYVTSTGGTTHTVPIDFRTAINTTVYGANNVYFNTAGSFGIGISSTTAPRGKLDVEGAIASGNSSLLTLVNTSGANGNAAIPYSFYIPSTTGDLNIASNDTGAGALMNSSYSAWDFQLGGQSDAFSLRRSPTGTQAYSTLFGISNTGQLSVAGGLSVGGGFSFANASTSQFSVFDRAYFGGTATTTIDSAGNLSVGGTATTTLAGFLDVNGTGANATSTFASNLWVKGTLKVGTGSIFITSNSISSTDGSINLSTGTATSTFANGLTVGTNQLTVQSATGNVGIGTISPAYKLDVNGIINATALYVGGSPYLGSQWTTVGSDIHYNTGKVGIGSSTPSAILAISNSASTAVNTPLFTIASTTGGTSTSTVMTVLANGNVGIGTATPSGPLHVQSATTFSATGGTITYTDSNGLNPVSSPAYSNGYTVHTFTTSGTFTPAASGNVEYLVVAGGGSGGSPASGSISAGGGGAGGFRTGTVAVSAGANTVTVGAGGTATANANGVVGSNSVFSTITALGGGGGGGAAGAGNNGLSGGSGGGGHGADGGVTSTGGAGTTGQGNAGGSGLATTGYGSGGGGGAGTVGGGGASSSNGNGGAGIASSISGTVTTYAGGGGGGSYSTAPTGGSGGVGGGGAGGSSSAGTAGTANTGGGGGGGSYSNVLGGNGGSGIVIVRYLSPGAFDSLVVNSVQGNVGIGTTAPSNALSFGNAQDQKIWIENSIADAVGRALSISAGSTVTGSSLYNVAGGDLNLSSGAGTGLGASNIVFSTGRAPANNLDATGGTITYTDSNGLNPRSSPAYAGGYTVHTFTTSGTFTANNAGSVDYLVVAGGAGGGGAVGGGGGAGGFRTGSGLAVTAQVYTVTVGAGGGGGGFGYYVGNPGGSSSFSSITAVGGGGGGFYGNGGGAGVTGGSGGGGTSQVTAAGAGTSGQGYSGGTGGTNTWSSGGGGGAGGPGINASTVSTNGGPGAASSISGVSVTYAGGGGAGDIGLGGSGGGGNAYQNAVANTGSGGGGGGWVADSSGSGGSGIVIIRHLSPTTATNPITEAMRIDNNGYLGIGTTNPTLGPLQMGSGAYVTTGGIWTNVSDRNLKTNFTTMDPQVILDKIVALPITQWNYKNEATTTTHIGPVAQDFYAAFGVGGDAGQTSISTVDPSGVALLGIQALNTKINAILNGTATSTITNIAYQNASTTVTDTLCLGGDCRTAWPATASSTSPAFAGYVSTTTLASSLAGYALLTNIPDVSSFVSTSTLAASIAGITTPDLSSYAHLSDLASATSSLATLDTRLTTLEGAGYLTASALSDLVSTTTLASTLASYATLASIPNVSSFVSTSTLAASIAGIPTPDLSPYATNASLASAISAIPTPDLSSYAHLSDLTTLISSAVASSTANIPSASLFGTVTGSMIPDTHNAYDLGTNSVRFANVYAQNVNAGDLTFTETTSAVSGNTFQPGDTIGLYVTSTGATTHTVPIDFRTAINTTVYGANNVYFNTAGKLGIGIPSSTALRGKLDVEGAITAGLDSRFLTLANSSSPAALPYSIYIPGGTGDLTIASNDDSLGSRINTSYPVWQVGLSGESDSFAVNRAAAGAGAFTATNLFKIASNGNVGVGTTSPYAKLSVEGDVVMSSFNATSTTATSTVAGNLSVTGNLNLNGALLQNNAPFIGSQWTTVGSNVNYSLGNVGIGSTTPSSLLSVQGNSYVSGTSFFGGAITATSTLTLSALATPAGSFLATDATGKIIATTTPSGGATLTGSTGQLAYFSGTNTAVGTSTMFITPAGNVGIGTATPRAKLNIVNPLSGSSLLASEASIGIGGTDEPLYKTIGFGYNAGQAYYPAYIGYVETLGTSATKGDLAFWTRNGTSDSAPTEVMRISSGQNVGIGTTSPLSRLSIQGSDTTSSNSSLNVTDSNGASKLFVRNDGNVGIGTTNPGINDVFIGSPIVTVAGSSNYGMLEMSRETNTNGDAVGTLVFTNANNTGGSANVRKSIAGIDSTVETTNANAGHNSGGNLLFFTKTEASAIAERMRITGAGNVGIGTTNPTSKLQVNDGNVAFGTTGTFAIYGQRTNEAANSEIASIFFGSGASSGSTGSKISTLKGSDNYTDSLAFFTSSAGGALTERTRITSGGNVGIGTTDPGTYKLNVNGTAANTAGGSWAAASDQRLKTAVASISGADALTKLSQLNPVTFDWINPSAHGNQQAPGGFLAQQIAQVFPEFVSTTTCSGSDCTLLGGADSNEYTIQLPFKFDAYLVAGIQTLDARTNWIEVASSTTGAGAAAAPVMTLDASTGFVGIGTHTPNARLTVSGSIFATSYEASPAIATSFAYGSTTLAVEIPADVLTAAGNVDLFKLATYNLAVEKMLDAKVDGQGVRITALEDRVTKLETGAVGVATDSPLSFSTTSLASAFEGLSAYIGKGFAQFGTLIADRFVAAKNSAGTSSAGTVTMLTGNTVAEVTNAYVTPATKIFVTFNSQITGSWWVSDKTNGSFRVVLSAAQTADVSFDYFLVQTEGQVATSTPDSNLEALPPSQTTQSSTSNSDTVAPVITLLGDNPLHLSVDGTFAEPGVTVLDNVDGTTDSIVTFVNDIQQEANATTITTASATTYTITYKATDAAGNTSTATRSVIVGTPGDTSGSGQQQQQAPADTIAPVVTLGGDAAMSLTVGDTFTDPGATATDDIDGPITPVVSGTVDTTKEGTYSLTYTATDAAGNIGTAGRMVTVTAAAPAPAPADTTATTTPAS